MSTHTLGPWHIEAGSSGLANRRVCDERRATVAEIWATYGRGSDAELASNRAANARLIAAAPEMLEALKLLADAIEPDDAPLLDIEPWKRERLQQARAAIAKAEGG